MSITVDSRNVGSSASADNLVWTHTTGSLTNGILIVGISEASASDFSVASVVLDPTPGANLAFTRKGRVNDSAGFAWAEIWYLLNPPAGAKDIRVDFTGTVAGSAGSASYDGVNQTTPFNAASPQTNTGSGATASVVVTSAVGELVFAVVVDDESATDTLVAGGGQTDVFNHTLGGNMAGAGSDAAGATTVTMSYTGLTLSPPWAMVGVSLAPAGGGGGGTSPMFRGSRG